MEQDFDSPVVGNPDFKEESVNKILNSDKTGSIISLFPYDGPCFIYIAQSTLPAQLAKV